MNTRSKSGGVYQPVAWVNMSVADIVTALIARDTIKEPMSWNEAKAFADKAMVDMLSSSPCEATFDTRKKESLSMETIEAEGVVKVVLGEMLESVTLQGYKVIGSYQDTHTIVFQTLIDAPANAAYSGGSYKDMFGIPQPIPCGKIAVSHHSPETRTTFVVQKDGKSAIGELSEKLTDMTRERDEATEDRRIAVLEHDKMKSELASSLVNNRNYQADVNRLRSDADKERELRRKLEVDLGKVRAAIGGLKFDEILASKS